MWNEGMILLQKLSPRRKVVHEMKAQIERQIERESTMITYERLNSEQQRIADVLLRGGFGFTSLNLPDSLQSIGSNAFQGCVLLQGK